jgi:glutathione S-transferase
MPGEEREEKLKQLVYQLDVLEATCKGPYMAGLEVTAGDATWLGTVVFLTEILPRVFHWGNVFQGRPKLAAWWALMQQDPAAAKVRLRHGRGEAYWVNVEGC